MESALLKQVTFLYSLLQDRSFYSRKLSTVELSMESYVSETGVHKYSIEKIIDILQELTEKINIFVVNGETYIGLESRRIDYERDLALNLVPEYLK
jgi:hypothetical protein